MVGHVDPQQDLYACDQKYLKYIGMDTFYGYLARQGARMFQDDDFTALHTQNNGRTSVPACCCAGRQPSLLA
ncbi:hypothetical protein FJY70_06345 [candidate division WOR-3 bacterium]|nr:hypothetical protein [candidate division WOR-3 bacterium]